jgi:hypothetical protein
LIVGWDPVAAPAAGPEALAPAVARGHHHHQQHWPWLGRASGARYGREQATHGWSEEQAARVGCVTSRSNE